MEEHLNPRARKVQEAIRSLGYPFEVVELPESTRSAQEAAEAIGCRVEQIAKSIVFSTAKGEMPLLIIASGSNRVNELRISEYLGEPIQKAGADFVRASTGFSIGGVPPVGHLKKLQIFIDEDLLKCEEIWAAAGTPHAVFRLTPTDLVKMTKAKVISIT
jgi:prolyl-tRNA editing enzyme YbaK/EbsC (Cys-tRNA(Pro) deacylase)